MITTEDEDFSISLTTLLMSMRTSLNEDDNEHDKEPHIVYRVEHEQRRTVTTSLFSSLLVFVASGG